MMLKAKVASQIKIISIFAHLHSEKMMCLLKCFCDGVSRKRKESLQMQLGQLSADRNKCHMCILKSANIELIIPLLLTKGAPVSA